jgi:hypothetical protein
MIKFRETKIIIPEITSSKLAISMNMRKIIPFTSRYIPNDNTMIFGNQILALSNELLIKNARAVIMSIIPRSFAIIIVIL